VCVRERASGVCVRTCVSTHTPKEPYTHSKRALHTLQKSPKKMHIHPKEPCTPSKGPYIHSNEPYTQKVVTFHDVAVGILYTPKEPRTHAKEPYIQRAKRPLDNRKSPLNIQKSSYSHSKSPIYNQKSPTSQKKKKPLHTIARDFCIYTKELLYALKKSPYIRSKNELLYTLEE